MIAQSDCLISSLLTYPPLLPEILKVENTTDPKTKEKKQYQEGFGDAIRLDWQISDLERIEKVIVIRLENNIETDRKTFPCLWKNSRPTHMKRQTQ